MENNIPAGYTADGEYIGFPQRGTGPRDWWAQIPPAERTERMKALATRRHAQLTPEQKTANAKRAITARWAKRKPTNS